jgi:hypothetical protein
MWQAHAANPYNYRNNQLQGLPPALQGAKFAGPSPEAWMAAADEDAAHKAALAQQAASAPRQTTGPMAAAQAAPANGVPRPPGRPAVPASVPGGAPQNDYMRRLVDEFRQGPGTLSPYDPNAEAFNAAQLEGHRNLGNVIGNLSQVPANEMMGQARLMEAQAKQQETANELAIANDPKRMAAAVTMKTGNPAMGANFAQLMDLYNGAPVTHENLPVAVGPGGPAAHLGELVGRAQKGQVDPATFADEASRIGVTPGSQAEQVLKHVANTAWDEPTWAAAHRGGSWNPFRGFQEDPQAAQRRQASMNRFRQLRALPAAG